MLKRGRARRAERTRKSTSVGGAREWERARESDRGRRVRERAQESEIARERASESEKREPEEFCAVSRSPLSCADNLGDSSHANTGSCIDHLKKRTLSLPMRRDTDKQSSSLSARCYPPPSLPPSLPNSLFPLPATRPPFLTCFTLGTDDGGIKAPGTLGNRTEASTAFRPSTRDIAKRSALSSRLSIRDAEGK
jgi:hypothetical protein